MHKRYGFSLLSLILVLSMALSACVQAQSERIVETVVVKEIVAGTPVEKVIEKVVTPTPVPSTAVPATAEPKPVDTVVFGMKQEPDTLHYDLTTMSASFFPLYAIFPRCALQNEKAEWVPMGCEEIPTIENGGAKIVGDGDDRHLEVTYKIRKGWRWTDGTPVTAKDSIYWWKLSMDPAFESQNRSVIEKIYEVTAIDDNTALVKFLSAKQIRDAVAGTLTGTVDFASFKDDYTANYTSDWKDFAVDPVYWTPTNFGWLPAHILESVTAADQAASEYSRKPIGDGAYVIKEWKPGQEIILEKSDQPFLLGEPKIKTIVFRFYGDGAAIKAALQSGEIDAALGSISGLTEKDGPDLDAIEAQGRYKVEWVPQYNYEHIDLNMTKFPTDDVLVRQAMYYALDRQAMNDTLYYGKKIVTDLPLPKGLAWAYPPDNELTLYNYDPEKAKPLLAQAGWDCSAMPCTKTVDGQPKTLEFTLMTTDRLDRMQLAQIIQQMWKQVGIGVNLQFLYGRGLFANCSTGGPLYCRTFDAAMYAFSSDDSSTFYPVYSCGAIPSEKNNFSGQNSPGWCNEAANLALNDSENNPENALSREKRIPYLTTFFKAMTNDVPVLFLFGATWAYPHLVNWTNFKAGPTQFSLPTWNPWEWEVAK